MLVGIALMSHWQVIAYQVAIILTAGTCVLIGSLRSKELSPLLRGEDEDSGCIERKEAIKLPIVASSCLLGCYFLVQNGWKSWIEVVASGYFTLIGVCAVKFFLKEALEPALSLLPNTPYRTAWKPPFSHKPLIFLCTFSDIFTYILSILLGCTYFFTQHSLLNNLFAISFSLYAIETTSLGNFVTAVIFLIGMCLYDGIWVQGTNILLTVLREIDVPIKLLFPMIQGETWTTDYAILGLGDIIIPGLVVALAYRLDYFLACKKEHKGAPKYFITALIGYLVGLSGSLLVPWTGLLCILPSLSIWLCLAAAYNHDFKAFQTYKEE